MSSPFDGYEVEPALRPNPGAYGFDLDQTLSAVVALEAAIPGDAYTAEGLGTHRVGNATVISPNGLLVTIGYLITEAEDVTLTLNGGRRIAAHPLGADPVSGLGLVQALEPLNLPALRLGDARQLRHESRVIAAGGGGIAHALAGEVLARMPFAGYWEYLLDEAIMTEPAHPHWSGAALVGASGDLLGVGSLNLQRRTRSGISPLNMFVPIDLLPPILDDLARGRAPHPPRPWLGVMASDAGDNIVVVQVTPNGPAARAQLRQGDVILEVAGAPVTELADFYVRLWGLGRPVFERR